MTQPMRIQRKRTRGWKMPPNTKCVDRSTKFGNVFRVDDGDESSTAVACFQFLLTGELTEKILRSSYSDPAFPPKALASRHEILRDLHQLRNRNLACFCRLCEKHKDGKPLGVECEDCPPCHADVLLELANVPDGVQT